MMFCVTDRDNTFGFFKAKSFFLRDEASFIMSQSSFGRRTKSDYLNRIKSQIALLIHSSPSTSIPFPTSVTEDNPAYMAIKSS
jgi:hypothetical protein